jgi:hypothetical protein
VRQIAYWDCGFESLQGHGCLSVVSACIVRQRALRRADQASREVIPTVACRRV